MTRRTRQFRCVLAALLVFGMVGRAQILPAPGAQAPAKGHESEEETVAKCLVELASADVQDRRRAILVLGKYSTREAMAALQKALDDPDALVRRSALVSFSERPELPPAATPRILARLADPDVHVRRIASSMLPDLVLHTYLIRRVGRERPSEQDPTVSAMDRALGDEDATVVRNVLHVAQRYSVALSADKVLACLSHADRDVRVLALQALRRLPDLEEPALLARLAPLAKDKDATIRRETAAALVRCGPAGLPALRELAADQAPEVRLAATKQLVLVEDERAPTLLATLLQDNAVDPEERASMVRHLLGLGGPVAVLLRKLAADGPTAVRAAAIQTMGNRRLADQAPPPEFFLKLLDDPQLAVRQASARALLTLNPRPDPAQTRHLLESKYPDVRRAALGRARLLPREQAAELLFDACLDDDLEVRGMALMQLAIGRFPGWEEILVQSLRAPEPEIREAAVNGLCLVRSEKTTAPLRKFLGTCEDPRLAQRIQAVLSREDRKRAPVLVPPRRVIRPVVPPNRP